MANAQDEAFRRLLSQRGLASVEAIRHAQAQPGNSLVHSLLLAHAVSHQDASGLLRELAQGSFACPTCRQVLAYDALSFLEQLSCPRCRVPLEIRAEAPPPLRADSLQPAPAQRGPAVGKLIGPYHLIKELGRGSNGVVFLAEREGLKRQFALKVLLSTSFADDEAIARFKLEAAVASKLDETGVIGVYDIGRDGGHYYYAMEYCPGITLQDLVQQGPVPPERAARIVAELAQTVHHAHEMGIIHRDLKPANVMLDKRSGRARITDFGLARAPDLGANLTRTGDVLGTPYYMAPEQLRGGAKVEPSIDVYALGVILYETLCAERPFEAPTVLELSKLVQECQPLPLTKRIPELPSELETICRRAMAKRPWARYRNAQELADDLERFLAGEIPLAALEAPSREAPALDLEAAPPGSRKLFLSALTVLLLTTGVVVGVAAHRRSQLTTAASPAPPPPGTEPPADLQLRLAALGDAARACAPTDEILEQFDVLAEETRAAPAAHQQVQLARGELLLRRGHYEACVRTMEQVEPGAGEQDLRRRWALASSQEKLEQAGPALQGYDTLQDYDPSGRWGLTAAAAACRLRGELDRSHACARRAFDQDPDHVPALVELALATLLSQRDGPRAEELLRRAELRAPDDHRVLLGLATVVGQREPREALDLLDRAAELGGDSPSVRVLIVRAQFRLLVGEDAGALEDTQAVLDRDPRQPEALFLGGIARWRNDQRQAARDDWALCYELGPNAFRQLLDAWPDLGERVRVRQALRLDEHGVQHTQVLFPVDEALHERLSKRAAWAGEAREPLTEALVKAAEGFPWSVIEPYFQAADAAEPESKVVALERVRILVGREEYDLALREIQRARELGVDPAELLRLEGEVWYTRGKQHVAAERYWDKLAASDQGLQGYCAMARTLSARGDAYEADANRAVEQALSIDPDHAPSLIAKALQLDPTEDKANLAELETLLARVLELQGYLDAQVFHLRIAIAVAPLADDQTIDKEDRWVIDQALQVYEDWALVGSGVTQLLAAAQLIMPLPDRDLQPRVRRYLEEARSLDPERGTPLMYLGFLKLITGKKPPPVSEVLAYWQRAREVEPMITIPPDWVKIFEQRYGDTSRLDALGIPTSER